MDGLSYAARLAGFFREERPPPQSPGMSDEQALQRIRRSVACRATNVPITRPDGKEFRAFLLEPRAAAGAAAPSGSSASSASSLGASGGSGGSGGSGSSGAARPAPRQPCVLLYCPSEASAGAGCNEALPIARLVLPLDVTVFAMDLSTSHVFCDVVDVQACVAKIRDPAFRAERGWPVAAGADDVLPAIALCGRSVGGNAALSYAALDPVASLICDGAFSDLPSLLGFPSWMASPFAGVKRALEGLADVGHCAAEPRAAAAPAPASPFVPPWEIASKVYVPALYVHGLLDRRVPSTCARSLREAHAGEAQLLLVDEGTHDSERPQKTLAQMAIFLHNSLQRFGPDADRVQPQVERLRQLACARVPLGAAGVDLRDDDDDERAAALSNSANESPAMDGAAMRQQLLFAALAADFGDRSFAALTPPFGDTSVEKAKANYRQWLEQNGVQQRRGDDQPLVAREEVATWASACSEVTLAWSQARSWATAVGRVAGTVRFLCISGAGSITLRSLKLSPHHTGEGLESVSRDLAKQQLPSPLYGTGLKEVGLFVYPGVVRLRIGPCFVFEFEDPEPEDFTPEASVWRAGMWGGEWPELASADPEAPPAAPLHQQLARMAAEQLWAGAQACLAAQPVGYQATLQLSLGPSAAAGGDDGGYAYAPQAGLLHPSMMSPRRVPPLERSLGAALSWTARSLGSEAGEAGEAGEGPRPRAAARRPRPSGDVGENLRSLPSLGPLFPRRRSATLTVSSSDGLSDRGSDLLSLVSPLFCRTLQAVGSLSPAGAALSSSLPLAAAALAQAAEVQASNGGGPLGSLGLSPGSPASPSMSTGSAFSVAHSLGHRSGSASSTLGPLPAVTRVVMRRFFWEAEAAETHHLPRPIRILPYREADVAWQDYPGPDLRPIGPFARMTDCPSSRTSICAYSFASTSNAASFISDYQDPFGAAPARRSSSFLVFEQDEASGEAAAGRHTGSVWVCEEAPGLMEILSPRYTGSIAMFNQAPSGQTWPTPADERPFRRQRTWHAGDPALD